MANLTRVNVVPNSQYQRSGPKSYVSLLRKYKFAPTKEGPYFVGNKVHTKGKIGWKFPIGGRVRMRRTLQKKTGDDQVGEVPAEDQQNDFQYLCEVAIGTPGQTLKLVFDTGSSDLWVWSTELPKTTSTVGHTVFNPSKSSTFKRLDNATWSVSYGDLSSASGTVGTDTIVVGGLSIEKQAIELANTVSYQFQQSVSDGILGLGFGSINRVTPTKVATPVENMISQADISKDKELFTCHLGSTNPNDSDNADRKESFYTFGYIDAPSLSSQEPYYVPIDISLGFWQFASPSITIGNQSYPRPGNMAVADTGTTLLLTDDTTCAKIYDAIPGSRYDSTQPGYVFPASTTADKLPVIQFGIGTEGREFAINVADLAFAPAGNGTFADAESGMIFGGVQSRGDLGYDIMGGIWLKGVYAIFDQGNKRFGVVQRKF